MPHYCFCFTLNLPKRWNSQDRSTDRYARVVCSGMGVAMVVFSVMMLFGFKTFGIASQALLLNNYHRSEDGMAGLARLATGFAIICGYPLMFAALKSSFLGFATEVLGKFEAVRGWWLLQRSVLPLMSPLCLFSSCRHMSLQRISKSLICFRMRYQPHCLPLLFRLHATSLKR
jgi:amino acid permease